MSFALGRLGAGFGGLGASSLGGDGGIVAAIVILLWGDESGDVLLWGDESGSLLDWGDGG